MTNDKKDLVAMKLLHYFITEKNYSPVIVHGIQNEIWLENMDSNYKIVRIVMNYIHNKEQLDFDDFKVSRLTKQIKFKTFTFSMKVMSIYLDLNDNLCLSDTKNNYKVWYKSDKALIKNEIIKKNFPDITDKLKFTEEGANLYKKINEDILRKNLNESEKIEELFSKKKPFVTYTLIIIMLALMILMSVFGSGSTSINTLKKFGALIKDKNPIRLISSMFLHIGLIHFIMNAWALKILGEQTESFYGHIKMLIIFIYSGIVGNLLSLILMPSNTISAGASGAIFGLMGSILYFALNQRTYMAEALRKQILPVIIVNLMLGFVISGINMYAHLGGLIGGMIISIALGVKYKTSKSEKINGFIASIILIGVLSYLAYFA